jgi:glycine betaine catabolism B
MYKITLKSKTIEYDQVFTLVFESKSKIQFKAGQYTPMLIPSLFLNFHKPVRPFSIASAPGEENIIFSINTKSNSKFQQKIQNMKIGDSVYLIVIKGHLAEIYSEDNVIMIAQGIGITPFRSMILDNFKRKLNAKISLIHIANSNFLYDQELKKYPFSQYRIARNQSDKTIKDEYHKNPEAKIYVAGSTNFVNQINQYLEALGVHKDKIFLDNFKGSK